MNTTYAASRHDTFARIIGIIDQMGDMWKDADQVRTTLNKAAVAVRDTQAPLASIADYVQKMQGTYRNESKGFAVLGCLQNVLRGGNRQGRN